MLDRPSLYRFNDGIGNRQHCMMGKTGHHLFAAVDSGKMLIFRIAAEKNRLFNDWRKVLVFADMHDFRIGNDFCCEDAVGIACLRRHQAVRREQYRSGDSGKFFLLILPGRSEVALQMRVLVQLWIGMSGKHFTMGVDVDPFSFGLFEKLLQIIKIMSRDNDERTFFNGQTDLSRRRIAVCLGIGFV